MFINLLRNIVIKKGKGDSCVKMKEVLESLDFGNVEPIEERIL